MSPAAFRLLMAPPIASPSTITPKVDVGRSHLTLAESIQLPRFCLCVRASANPPIDQALAADLREGAIGAHGVGNAKARTIGMAEIELGEISLEVRFADAVERPDDAAFQDREVVPGGV